MAETAESRVKERPILFSGPMVRAILAGTKTMTRRIVTKVFQDTIATGAIVDCIKDWDGSPSRLDWAPKDWEICPYGVPGQRLWVRETWRPSLLNSRIEYRADTETTLEKRDGGRHWRPSIFMPRTACRITLEITATRAERLHDMPPRDVNLEGFPFGSDIDAFKALWKKLNGAESWDSNPWCWVISFNRFSP